MDAVELFHKKNINDTRYRHDVRENEFLYTQFCPTNKEWQRNCTKMFFVSM